MAAITLPYLSTPGTLDKALPRIKEAAKPDRFTAEFVNNVLQVKGGTGSALIPFLKKIGFISGDGAPTPIYERYRNSSTSGKAMADAIRYGYKPLYQINESAHKLSDHDLKGAIVQVTGLEQSNNVVKLISLTFKRLVSQADFVASGTQESEAGQQISSPPQIAMFGHAAPLRDGLNLSYTINLNLPATTNIEVFHAIFRSLREHLLNG